MADDERLLGANLEADDDLPPTAEGGTVRVVGIGGSAGSIPAMQRFFSAMPTDSGMAFVVVLHLSPEHESALSQVLQTSTSMPVTQACDGEPVSANHVYVIPPGRNLSLLNGRLRLTDLPRERGRRLTVDLFFRSLADAQGARSVGIVFSGGDGDGALGIKRIKERGGLTIAQDPHEAEHSGMPRSAIATNMVDWVLTADKIPAHLLEYQARERRLTLPSESGPNPAMAPRPSSSIEEAALRDVLTFLRARTGRDFTYYKRATIVRRVARRMQVNAVDDLPAYLTFLRVHPGEAGALLQDLLISVTNFFRDRESFTALEAQIPELFRNKTAADTVRVWVPACATGEEAYSIAMLLSEHARTLDLPPTLQIFASDLDENVLAEARNGFYPSSISTDVSPERLQRFFVQEPHGYRVRRELREMLLFAVHDLLKDSPFSRLDLISCRNLLIYLNRAAQQRTFDIFHFALRPDGRLFLGTSESTDDCSQLFHALDKKHRLYVKRSSAQTSLPLPDGPGTLARALAARELEPGASLARRQPGLADAFTPSAFPSHDGERLSLTELHLKLVERFGPPSLLVNGENDVVHLSESASSFLQFPAGEPSTNLFRLLHPSLRFELHAAVLAARQTGEPSVVLGVSTTRGEAVAAVDVRVSPALDLAPDVLLVTFVEHARSDLGSEQVQAASDPAAQHLERELERTKDQLRDMLQQHEVSTEELKASNEELQAMNEELRSATEELETSREELQSINEELTTVNQELKNKVDELGHTNSDLHNLMGATAIATVFLDRELQIMRFTPSAVDLFSFIPTDVGRPLGDLQHRLIYPELLSDADRVLKQLVAVEREVAESSGRFFLARLLPYRTTDDRIAGVVLTFVDVTERQLAQQAVHRAQLELEDRVRQRTAQLAEANDALRQEVIKQQTAERARQDLQRRLINAQEEERRRVSRELHDEVGQQILAMMLSLRALENETLPADAATKLRALRESTELVGTEIHQLASQLRPVALDVLGLSQAVSTYLESWGERSRVAVDFFCSGIDEPRLPSVVEITLYRIIQEATTNVVRHAAAHNVSVSIERRKDHVIGIVEDDGKGFDFDMVRGPSFGRIGIAGMQERAAIVDGELTIDSGAGGTTVRVKLPLPTP
ncbi:MAG TPA: chemotaxis protein CheB [Polyangiaceae bacterium]|jgi:two-component system CheB/CheR fusion protein|nr:chemotaxis protein CheB [Polyangiaceae bacterium]